MFVNESNSQLVKNAVDTANELLMNKEFYNAIIAKESFDMSEVSSEFIAEKIQMFRAGIFSHLYVYTYYPKWRWSKAYGYFSPSNPDHIYLNAYKLIRFSDNKRNTASLVASLIHESIHFLSHKTNKYFNHGDNSPVGKDNTAPYWIDNLAESFIMGQNLSQKYDNDKIVIYVPWYKRLYRWFKGKF